jgi:hypothetical protein
MHPFYFLPLFIVVDVVAFLDQTSAAPTSTKIPGHCQADENTLVQSAVQVTATYVACH